MIILQTKPTKGLWASINETTKANAATSNSNCQLTLIYLKAQDSNNEYLENMVDHLKN